MEVCQTESEGDHIHVVHSAPSHSTKSSESCGAVLEEYGCSSSALDRGVTVPEMHSISVQQVGDVSAQGEEQLPCAVISNVNNAPSGTGHHICTDPDPHNPSDPNPTTQDSALSHQRVIITDHPALKTQLPAVLTQSHGETLNVNRKRSSSPVVTSTKVIKLSTGQIPSRGKVNESISECVKKETQHTSGYSSDKIVSSICASSSISTLLSTHSTVPLSIGSTASGLVVSSSALVSGTLVQHTPVLKQTTSLTQPSAFVNVATSQNPSTDTVNEESSARRPGSTVQENSGASRSQDSDNNSVTVDKNESDSSKMVYRCGECDYASDNKHYYKQHVDLVHNTARPFKCPFCDYAGKRSHALREHLVVHSSQRPYSCQHCNASFRKKGHLTNHTKLHSSSSTSLVVSVTAGSAGATVAGGGNQTQSSVGHPTLYGNPPTSDVTLLTTNNSSSVSLAADRGGDFWCALCSKQIASAQVFQDHLKSVHGTDRLYSCESCSFVTASKAAMMNHLPTHIQSTTHQPPATSQPSTTTSQPDGVPATKPVYACSECGFATPTMSALVAHAVTHVTKQSGGVAAVPSSQPQPQVICSECGHVAESADLMRAHMWNHINVAHSEPAEKGEGQVKVIGGSLGQVGGASTVKGNAEDNGTTAALKCTECSFVTRHASQFVKHLLVHKTQQNQLPKTQIQSGSMLRLGTAVPSTAGNEQARKNVTVFKVKPVTTENTCTNTESSPFVHDASTGRFRCTICGYTCEYQRTIKAHIWKHSGHRRVHYPTFQNGPLSMYDEPATAASVPDVSTSVTSSTPVPVSCASARSNQTAATSVMTGKAVNVQLITVSGSKVVQSSGLLPASPVKLAPSTASLFQPHSISVSHPHNVTTVSASQPHRVMNASGTQGRKDGDVVVVTTDQGKTAVSVNSAYRLSALPHQAQLRISCPTAPTASKAQVSVTQVKLEETSRPLTQVADVGQRTYDLRDIENYSLNDGEKKSALSLANPNVGKQDESSALTFAVVSSGSQSTRGEAENSPQATGTDCQRAEFVLNINSEDTMDSQSEEASCASSQTELQSTTAADTPPHVDDVACGSKGQELNVVVESMETVSSHSSLTGLRSRAASPSVTHPTTSTSPLTVPHSDKYDALQDVNVRTLRSGKKRPFAVRVQRSASTDVGSVAASDGSVEETSKSRVTTRRQSLQDSESAVTLLSLLNNGPSQKTAPQGVSMDTTATEAVDASPDFLPSSAPISPECDTVTSDSVKDTADDIHHTDKESSALEKSQAGGRGICSTLLAVIEQLRERSRCESEGEDKCAVGAGKKRGVGRSRGKQEEDEGLEPADSDNVETLCKEDGLTYRCKLCHYTNNRVPLIRIHMKTHRQKDPFECSLCPLVAASSEMLQEHMIQHCKVRTYTCKFCPQSFNHKSTLRAHMRAHNHSEPFLCDLCDFETSSPLDYRTHMQKHVGEVLLRCPYCSSLVKTQQDLRKHWLACGCNVSNTLDTKMDTEDRLQCLQCDFTTNSISGMQHHSATHAVPSLVMSLGGHGEGSLRCALCDFTAVSSRSLKSHMKRHANDQRYVQQPLEQYKCSLCGYVCHHLPSLKSHMWRHASHENYSYQFTNDVINAAIDYDTRPAESANQQTVATPDNAVPVDDPELLDRVLSAERRIVEGQMNQSGVSGSKPVCWVTFRCCQCGFETINKAKLNLHMRTHADLIQHTLQVRSEGYPSEDKPEDGGTVTQTSSLVDRAATSPDSVKVSIVYGPM